MATTALVVLIIVGFFATWFNSTGEVFFRGAFLTGTFLEQPWSLVTYPFVETQFLSVLFACLWLWGIGGVVERMEGPKRMALFWLAMSILCALGLWMGSKIIGKDAILANAWTPIAAVTIVWGTRRPSDLVNFMLVLPISARWMAWLSVALVFFGCRTAEMEAAPLLAPFAAAPLVFAWLYAKGGLASISLRKEDKTELVRGAGFYSKEYFDEVKRREKAREEKEKLRKLFESSSTDDPEDQ